MIKKPLVEFDYTKAKPMYHKAMWHNCNKCKIHFMSEEPRLTAYLCDECFNSMPHYRSVRKTKVSVGPTHSWPEDINLLGLLLYILGCSLCLLIMGYYLWVK